MISQHIGSDHGPQDKSDWPLFLQIKFCGNSHIFIIYNHGCFGGYRQSEVVETEGLQPAKPNIFTSSSFRKKKFDSCTLIPCYTEWGSKNRYYHPGLFEMQNLGSQNWIRILHCNKIPQVGFYDTEAWETLPLGARSDRNTHALHWCKFHPTPSYQCS